MKLKHLLTVAATGLGAIGGAMLVYGALVEAKRLTLERYTLRLKDWPESLKGTRIAVIGDFHLRDSSSIELAQDAIAMALDESPDYVVLVGDFVGRWQAETPWMLGEVLGPLLMMDGNVIAVPGNHEYVGGDADLLETVLNELNIEVLRNDSWSHGGITWIGIDSFNAGMSNVSKAFEGVEHGAHHEQPKIVVWHEPDTVDVTPPGVTLQISGHSHGGQFKIFDWAPMTSTNGRKYIDGFYPTAPTPIFVTRGVGTTGPPSRFNCTPQVAILTLVPQEEIEITPVAKAEPLSIHEVLGGSAEEIVQGPDSTEERPPTTV